MAKSKESQNAWQSFLALVAIGVLVILFTIIIILIKLIPVVFPALALILFFVYVYYTKQEKTDREMGFWLYSSEKEKFKTLYFTLSQAYRKRKEVDDAVVREGHHINKNGRISAKSYRGSDLQGALDEANATISEYEPLYSALENQPVHRWKKCKKHYSRKLGFGFATLFWIIFLLFSADNLGQNFSQYFAEIRGVGSSGFSTVGELWGLKDRDTTSIANLDDSVISVEVSADNVEVSAESVEGKQSFSSLLWENLFWSLVAYFIFWLIGVIIFYARYKKPPIVSINNVDTYVAPQREREKESKPVGHNTALSNTAKKQEPQRVNNSSDKDLSSWSKEQKIFNAWAESLKREGYNPVGNWENWEEKNDWKNMAVELLIGEVVVNVTIEYYAAENQLYFGIQKHKEGDRVLQSVLNNETLKKIARDFGLTMKNNEWWYYLKFVSFDQAYPEYKKFIETLKRSF